MSRTVAGRSVTNPWETAQARDRKTVAGGRIVRLLGGLVRGVPTLLVLALLGGLVAYGHHTGWKLPKFSSLAGTAAAVRDDWCEEHAVPESKCVECNPDLMPKGSDYGWCPEHGVHNCTLHHPHVAQLKETPVVPESDFARAARALALRDRPENNAACAFYRKRIQFASVEAVQQAGIDVELVDRKPASEWVAGSGEITYDETRRANLASRVPGTVFRVEKNVGDAVREGDVLALIDAADIGRAKTELVQALAQEALARQALDRLKGLTSVVAGRQVEEAEAEHTTARARVLGAQQSLSNLGVPVELPPLRDLSEREVVERLRFLGLPEALVSELRPHTQTANLIPVRAPMDGVIIARNVVAGEVVDASRPLFEVADTGRMWLTLAVSPEEAALVALGQPVRFRPDGRGEVAGTVNWISTAADKQTRMVAVRADLPNPDGRLRDETFGAGRIVLRQEQDAIVVPEGAVHSEGCCQVVFVRDKGYFESPESPKVFHVRTVRTGAKEDGSVEILAGVLPGEVVATAGSDVLRAQLLKNSLGEGCTCGQ